VVKSTLKRAALFAAIFFLCGPFEVFAQAKHPRREFELRAESPAFWKLVARDAKLETVATGFGFTEGPVWDKAGFLHVSDPVGNQENQTNDCGQGAAKSTPSARRRQSFAGQPW